MKERIPLALSAAALVVAVLGATPIGLAARHAIATVPPFAKNAGSVNGIKAARTPKAHELLPLGANRKFPASVVPVGPRGPQGAAGPQGPAGATGPAGPAATLTGVTAGGDLTGTYPNPQIARDAVGNLEIADNAVDTPQIADQAVDTEELASGAVHSDELAPGAVDTPELAFGAVDTAELADDAVTGDKVQDGTLTLADISPLSGTVTVDVPLVAGNSCISQSVNVPGRNGSDLLFLEPSTNFTAGLVTMPIFDTADGDNFTVRVCNVTTGAIDPPSGVWGYAVFR